MPPVIDETNSSYSVIYRDSVSLYCPATGHPRPTINWFKNGSPISLNELNQYVTDQGTLVIRFATEDDAGTYTCMVSNKAGTDEIEISLYVLGKSTL